MTATGPGPTTVRDEGLPGAPLDVLLADAALGPLRRMVVGTAGVKLAARVAAHPGRALRQSAALAAEGGRILLGRSDVEPDRRDRRFADPAWTGNPALRRVSQSYLATARALEAALDEAQLDWRDDERVRFALQMVVDALAPSNNPLLNPTALKTALDTGGGSLLFGLKQLVQDLARAPHTPSMVDGRGFTVGGNLAATTGAVVLRTPVVEVLQYAPSTPVVREVPLLLVPPMINKFYVADLAPGRSMIEHYVASGQQVFTISWRNPGAEQRDWDLDRYGQAVLDAMDAVQEVTGTDRVHLLGLCAGGIVSSMVLGHLAATGAADRVAGLTLGVTMLDQARAGTVGALTDPQTAQLAQAGSARRGYLDGRALAGVFAWLRPNDLVWNYWVNNYLLGKRPPAFDVLFWNDDTTRMPAGLHRDFIALSLTNGLTEPGGSRMLGSPVDLGRVEVDSYVVAGVADHICPWENCYRSTQLLGGESRFVLSTSGHIAALVNPPGNPKASYRAATGGTADPQEWLRTTPTHPGSWWTDHAAWLGERSGTTVPARAALGSDAHPALDAAPGTYVLQT